MTQHLEIHRGDSPLVLGLPHTGALFPEGTDRFFNDTGHARADTDWHIDTLYQGLVPGVTSVRTRVHRYVIDVNRDPSGQSLYPGQNTTDLCPTTDFDGRPIYADGAAPDSAEIARRCREYHAPYHAALDAEMRRVAALHGFAVLYDCHSIRGHIPFLFDGQLPDLNVGTNNGQTCDPMIERRVMEICAAATPYTHILNGRFKGGWTTRHYGRPATGWHAIQMELAQSTYMMERQPWDMIPERAEMLRSVLSQILNSLIQWRPA